MANKTLALTGQPVLGVFNQHNTTHLDCNVSLQDRYRPITSSAQGVSGYMNVAFRMGSLMRIGVDCCMYWIVKTEALK